MNKKTLIITAVLVIPLIVVGVMRWSSHDELLSKLPANIRPVSVVPPVAIQDFTLTSMDKRPVKLDDLKGKWSFVFFGYTSCPDVCPATLAQLALVNKTIKKNYGDKTKPVFYFVSVDPGRDTPKRLAAYITYFDKDFIAMTGANEDVVLAFEKQFGAYHTYGQKDSHGNYPVSHSADIYLVDPDGAVVAKFRPPMNIPQMAQQYSEIIDFFNHNVS